MYMGARFTEIYSPCLLFADPAGMYDHNRHDRQYPHESVPTRKKVLPRTQPALRGSSRVDVFEKLYPYAAPGKAWGAAPLRSRG